MRSEIPAAWFCAAMAVIFALAFGIVANPYLLTFEEMLTPIVYAEALVAVLVLPAVILSARWIDLSRERIIEPASPEDARRTVDWLSIATFVIIAGLWLALYRDRWLAPRLKADDYDYLRAATDWPTTLANLFVPYNEHIVVPTRLLTFALVWASNDANRATIMTLSTIPLFLAALVQIFLLGRREWQSPAAGLLAVALFAVSKVYSQIIEWYSASQWLWAFNLLLLGLLLLPKRAAGAWRTRLFSSASVAFGAVFSFSVGLLVGPLCSAWFADRCERGLGSGRWLRLAVPTVGTAAGVAIVMPILLSWFGTAEYHERGGRGIGANFDPVGGALISTELAANLVLHNRLTFFTPSEQLMATVVVVPIGLFGLVWHLRRRPQSWSLAPMLMMIAIPYALAIPFRTWAASDIFDWNRYQLIPQLGFSLLVVGIAAAERPDWFAPGPRGLRARQAIAIVLIAVILELINDRTRWR